MRIKSLAGILSLALSVLFAMATVRAEDTATNDKAIEVLSYSLSYGSWGLNESVILAFATREKPPEQADANGLQPAVLDLLLFDQDGNLLSDSANPTRLTIPRLGFRTASIHSDCFDICILSIDTGDGATPLPKSVKPLHDRVLVRFSVVCVKGPCTSGVSGKLVVVGPNGATQTSSDFIPYVTGGIAYTDFDLN